MSSKAEKKRRRRQRRAEEHALTRDPFALAPVPRRELDGDSTRKKRDTTPKGADRPALMKRASMTGQTITEATIRDMRAPWYGCEAGRAIAAHTKHDHEREKLWAAVCHMRRVVTAYDRAIGAPNRHAQCLRLLTPLERFEANASSPPLDDRTDAEKQRQAVAASVHLKAWLTYVDYAAASEAIRVVIDDEPVRDATGLMIALRCVHEGMEGGTIRLRDRTKERIA